MNDKRRSNPPKPASSDDALAFVRDLQEKFLKPDRRLVDDEGVRAFLNTIPAETLTSIASRVLIDVLKCPQPVEALGDGKQLARGLALPPANQVVPELALPPAKKNEAGS